MDHAPCRRYGVFSSWVAVLLTALGCRMQPTVSVVPAYPDVAYATLSKAQELDLYLPTGGTRPYPVIVLVHGGAFMMGDKADAWGLAPVAPLLEAGYAVASINYRLSDEAKYPAQIHDAKAAVRFLRAHGGEYGLDPSRFGAWGASAGGNLVSLLGTTCGVQELEGADLGAAGESSCVQAVVDWFGPIDFLTMDAQFEGTDCPRTHDAQDSPESRLVGAAIQSAPELVLAANPMNYITPDDPPFLIQNGTEDCNIPPAQNRNFAEALRAVIEPRNVIHIELEGAGHGGPAFDDPQNLQRVIAFLDAVLKPG